MAAVVGSCDFEPLDENCKIDDSFAAALMHFVRIAEISSALVTVPGYRCVCFMQQCLDGRCAIAKTSASWHEYWYG